MTVHSGQVAVLISLIHAVVNNPGMLNWVDSETRVDVAGLQ